MVLDMCIEISQYVWVVRNEDQGAKRKLHSQGDGYLVLAFPHLLIYFRKLRAVSETCAD